MNLIRNLLNLYVSWTFVIQLSVICLRHSSTCEEKARAAKERTPKKRFMWKDYINSVPDKHFRRTFRMSKGCFMELCKRIRNAVGEDTFKSEEYITTFQEKDVTSINYKKRRMAHARAFTSGECICGEVKLAVTLRLLAGAHILISQLCTVVGTHTHIKFFTTLYAIGFAMIRCFDLMDWIISIT